MEIFHKFQQNGHFTSELYYLLSKKKMTKFKDEITPSDYIKQITMTTAKRLRMLKDIEIDNINSSCKKSDVILSFSPKIIVFQNVRINDTITTKFSVLNISKAPTFINMVYQDSPYFTVRPFGGKFLSRLAPGMSVTLLVTFTPQQQQDYVQKVSFFTDKDEYVMLLIGMGPRPVLNFPDDLVVPKTPLKMEKQTEVSIHNIGEVVASFSLITKCPFYVHPKSITLNPTEIVFINVAFKSSNHGDTSGALNILLETGENFHINLLGTTFTINIELERQVVKFLDTYNTMVRQLSFKITNNSPYQLNYFCMKNRNIKRDFEDNVKLATVYYKFKESELLKCNKLEEYDVLRSDDHERVYGRIFADEIQALVINQSFLYIDTHFDVLPLKGVIWSNTITELIVTFAPKSIGEFVSEIYFDIDGVLGRVPLKLIGTSLPPAIQLNMETLNLGLIYVNKEYNYEIVASNRGHIKGVVAYKDTSTLFGSKISCNPIKICLESNQEDMFVLSFCNSNQGPFFEEVVFSILDTEVILKLCLKGEIVYPSIEFSLPYLDFGFVSLGVPNVLEFDVVNKSIVQVLASVKIPSDGPEINSITLVDFEAAEGLKPTLPEWPKEFNICPKIIDMEPESRITLKVTLCANLIRANKTVIECEFDQSDSPPITLPVLYDAKIPVILPAPEIKLSVCFVHHPYKYDLVLKSNEYWGYFTADDVAVSEMTLNCEIKLKEGFIKPNSSFELPIEIQTDAYGEQELDIKLNLFGCSMPITICHIMVCGVRPIVTCTPTMMHWGQMVLLKDSMKYLTVFNDSPVCVYFKTYLQNSNNVWKINPSEGCILPETEISLRVTLHLIDAVMYQNKIIISLEDVKDIHIPVSATGIGSSIVIGKSQELITIGRYFTKVPFTYKTIIENRGAKLHTLEWSEYPKPPKIKEASSAFYKLEPKAFKLSGQEKLELVITGVSNKASNIKEKWYLFGNIEGVNKKELLLEVDIDGDFVDPIIEIYPSMVELRYDYGPYNELYKLTEIITIKNISKLQLDLDISIKSPFVIIHKSTYKVLSQAENMCCCISYNESDLNMSDISRIITPKDSEVLIDYLTLKPVELLRRSPLNFFEDINKLKMVFKVTDHVEEKLDDEEIMKLQILLDTTKHTTLNSRIYNDFIRINFKGLTRVDKYVIKLTGNINFPNLSIPSQLDFRCLLNGSIKTKCFKIQNTTPLIVCYKFQWNKYEIFHDHAYESTKELFKKNPETSLTTDNDNVINQLIPMINVISVEDCLWKTKFDRNKVNSKDLINDIFQLLPHRGVLKPNETHYVNVIFKPINNINIKAQLECSVLGGPTEICTITGQSSDLHYELNTRQIKFGIRPFYEIAVEELTIKNTARLPIKYKISLDEFINANLLEAVVVEVDPPEKLLQTQETISVKILVKPGILGYFERKFLLEIGHLPEITIKVTGYGVIPQMYLSFTRPDIIKLPNKAGYEALFTLTEEYITLINKLFNRDEQLVKYLPEINCNAGLSNDWYIICSTKEEYPKIVDIELAIERNLIINYLRKRPEILKQLFTNKMIHTIPGFVTIPYTVDFGVIITGTTVHRIADVVNYGPIPLKASIVKGKDLPQWLHIKLCGKLTPGELGKIEIIFTPTSQYFPALEETIDYTFKLEVTYSITIPINVKAMCAVPFLISNISNIDFGAVKCGEKAIMSIPIKNVGKTTCVWWVNVKIKFAGISPITIHNTSGKLEPNEGEWLRISFKPSFEMLYEGLLIFRFHMNPNRMTIPIKGQGLCPILRVIGERIEFPPTLPHSQTSEIYFGITNPCTFPIELIFVHCDTKWKEEEEIYNILQKYYDKPKEILMPPTKLGCYYPQEIMDFYTLLKDLVQMSMDEQTRDVNSFGKKSAGTARKGKTPKSTTSISQQESKILRNEDEIIKDEMRKMKDNKIDPLKVFTTDSDEDLSDIKHNNAKGLLIFVHASPCEETKFLEMGYTIGKNINLPIINFDTCVAKALCDCHSSAKDSLMATINELYYNCVKNIKPDEVEEVKIAQESTSDNLNEFEIIQKKLNVILDTSVSAGKGKQFQNKQQKKTPTTSLSTHAGLGSSVLFDQDVILELLSEYFASNEFSFGFVVDTLTSQILNNPGLVMTTLLKCKRSIKNIHLILCNSDFMKWSQNYEEVERAISQGSIHKDYTESEIETIVKDVDEMNNDEYENASEHLKAVYIKNGLEERRIRYLQKSGKINESIIFNKPLKSTQVIDSESKKKLNKKEDARDTDTLKKSGKLQSEYLLMNTKYNDYIKNTFDNLVNIANNWLSDECEMGYPVLSFNGKVVGANQKKTKKKSESMHQVQLADIVTEEERGFPLTILASSCYKYKDALVSMFLHSSIVQTALKEKEAANILDYPVKHKLCRILLPKILPTMESENCLQLKFLEEPIIKKCECYPITDIPDDIKGYDILSQWQCTCDKKDQLSKTSLEESKERSETSSKLLYLNIVKSLLDQSIRLVLEPGDLVRCKFTFNPKVEGTYSLTRYVEVTGWPESRVVITATGVCDLPRLDGRPKKMFNNFIRRRIEGFHYKLTFLDDIKIFEFGPIFIGINSVYAENYKINLRNSSLIKTETTISYMNDTVIFSTDQEVIVLEPGSKGQLNISAAPVEIGTHKNVLMFCTKNNPETVIIEVCCCGVIPSVDILPFTKNIDFGKLLLYRREDDRFIVKNNSILPIMWVIRNTEEFSEDFVISRTSGIIPANENEVIPITYKATKIGVISHRDLIVDIFDANMRGVPMITDIIYISAECYDVKVNCSFETPEESYLNYGNVKVNSTVTQEMYLYNEGKYNIYYKLKKLKSFPYASLLNSMTSSETQGLLTPTSKATVITFQCTPTLSLKLVNVPIYTCYLLDGTIEQVVVAKFPVCITIASFYNTFTLFPLGELSFHIIPVGSGVIREVIINNTSKCPFTYDIKIPEKYRQEVINNSTEKSKGKDVKIKVPPLNCGNFIIYNEANLLEPGASRTLQIHFLATGSRTFEETIHFIVSDTCPAESSGVPLKLIGTGATPMIDIWNLESTFREHLIVKKITDYKIRESTSHCVFAEDTVTLNFFCVAVNTAYTASIDLYNNGLVPSVLTMTLNYNSNTNNNVFYLDKYEMTIEPLLHKTLNIIFEPKNLQEYVAMLEIKLKLLENQGESYKINLTGEGNIPRIEFITPPIKQKIGVMKFPVTCIGSVSKKEVKFKNISSIDSNILISIVKPIYEEKHMFSMSIADDSRNMIKYLFEDDLKIQVSVNPNQICTIIVNYDPTRKGRVQCDLIITIENNPFENYTVMCDAEAFMEDIILIGLELLPLGLRELSGISSAGSRSNEKKKVRTAEHKSKRKKSSSSIKTNLGAVIDLEKSIVKYVLDLGGCEINSLQRRTVIMANNCEKVYKFNWRTIEYIAIKPSVGFIAPGEEKDFEIMFYSNQQTILTKEELNCTLYAINNEVNMAYRDKLVWNNNQTMTVFDGDRTTDAYGRKEVAVEDQQMSEMTLDTKNILLFVSAITDYVKFSCDLNDEIFMQDTLIYQKTTFDFKLKNTGIIPIKVKWNFQFDEEFPARINKAQSAITENIEPTSMDNASPKQDHSDNDPSTMTLFSGESDRASVDTWLEIDLPFNIIPDKKYIQPNESQVFKVVFAPLDAFNYKVRLKSIIENINPYERNISTRIIVRSLIPNCHLDIDESDYLTSGRRKHTEIQLPNDVTVLEFNVLGTGCFKKAFKVLNPTNESYEFNFEMVKSDRKECVPFHCHPLKGFVESGNSSEITFTFAPTAYGITESMWHFVLPKHSLILNILVVGIVREPDVVFIPTIIQMKNALVNFTITDKVILKNNESECLQFEFKGASLCSEIVNSAVIMEPNKGILKPLSEKIIWIRYTPTTNGALSFKIFCNIQYLSRYLTLCVNTLSYLVKPCVLYYIVGNEHVLKSNATTHIHLEKVASEYMRSIPFVIKNEGSASFRYDWYYTCSRIKKYMTVDVEPKSGYISPGDQVSCALNFTLRDVPVKDYPVSLTILNGPEYNINLNMLVEKPLYHFSFKEYDFGECIVNVSDMTYKKILAFINDDNVPIIVNIEFENTPDLLIHYHSETRIAANDRLKIKIYFRPKQVKDYEFKLKFWINSLCEENVIIRGQGVPLLIDLYEGCNKSYDLGIVQVGQKITKEFEVINHSQVAVDANFVLRDLLNLNEEKINSEATSIGEILETYKNTKLKKQITKDAQNALDSLKIIPNFASMEPHRKIPIKIQFKPTKLINKLEVQLDVKVYDIEIPLMKLKGSATGMLLYFSQNSLQFGRVRKHGCKNLKIMLLNKGDFNTRFWWQPMISSEFSINPMQGIVEANTNVTFTISFRPDKHNPFVKGWACCNLDNYKPLEIAMYGTCLDIGEVHTKSLTFECPVRQTQTNFVNITNPTDSVWEINSQLTGSAFETLREIRVEPNSSFDIPVIFKPKTMKAHEGQIIFSPLGETALMVTVAGVATNPLPSDSMNVNISAKKTLTENLLVYNLTEFPETYSVTTEVTKTVPDKFDGHFEIKHSQIIKVWGEAAATCRWSYVCYEECEMHIKVMFINEITNEYQYYLLMITVTPSEIVDVIRLTARARDTVVHNIILQNPLAEDADFRVQADYVTCPDSITIPNRSEEQIPLKFSPLVVGVIEDLLVVYNKLVGSLFYKLILKCLPATEKIVESTTPIGTRVPVRLRVENRADVKADFICNVSNSSIQIEKEYQLDPFEKGKFLVWFEPVQLGTHNCMVSLNSAVAGEFTFKIIANATLPKPQGPIEIRSGASATIKFKNVFEETKIFKMNVDKDAFIVKSPIESLKSKKDCFIIVSLNEFPRGKSPPTGTLTIELEGSSDPKILWTYFLQGIL